MKENFFVGEKQNILSSGYRVKRFISYLADSFLR